MNSQSIYFLQALWDVDVQKDRLLKIARDSMKKNIEQTLKGALDPKTIWNSPKAKELYQKITDLKNSIDGIRRPYDLLAINNQFIDTAGKIRVLQIQTAQSLNSEAGIQLAHLHIIAKQLIPYAMKQLKNQTNFQLYRYLVLGGSIPDRDFYYPESSMIEEWIYFYEKKLMPLLSLLQDGELDGRWAYERRRIAISGGLIVEQFVKVEPREKELNQPLGIPGIGTGELGAFRIFGRGKITNLNPFVFENGLKLKIRRRMSSAFEPLLQRNENSNPKDMLDQIMGRNYYLISPDEYFTNLNKQMLAGTFHQRIKTGTCFLCGGPLYKNKCTSCGSQWKF